MSPGSKTKKQKKYKEEIKKADNSSASFGLDSGLIKNNIEFRELFNNMKSCVAIYEVRNNGRDFFFKDFNYAAEKFEKIKKEEILGKNVKDVFGGAEKMGLLGVFRRVYKTGKSEDFPLKFYQDNKIFGWRDNFVYKLPTGEIVAIYEDVTEQKKLEESLKIKNFIFNHSMASNGIVDTKGIISEANQSFLNVWGFLEKEEVVGKSLTYFFNNQEDALSVLKSLNKNGNWNGDFVAKKKDGSTFIAYGTAANLINEKGVLIGYQLSLFDITERKKAEEIIKLDEEKFEEIFNYSPIAIELYNIKGELEKVNKATLEMFGVKEEKEIIGFKLFDDPNLPEDMKKALKRGELVKYENIFDFEKVRKFNLYSTMKNGTIHLSTVITPIKKGLAGYLVMVEDITQNKDSQIKLQEKLEEMEKMNRLMVGRELKMIELKNKIEEIKLKTKK